MLFLRYFSSNVSVTYERWYIAIVVVCLTFTVFISKAIIKEMKLRIGGRLVHCSYEHSVGRDQEGY